MASAPPTPSRAARSGIARHPCGSEDVLRRAQTGCSDKPHWHKLGAHPGTSLAEARRAAPAILRTLADGKTPKEVKDDQRRAEAAQARAEADWLRNTFGAVAEDFIKEHLPRLRSAKPAEALIRNKRIPPGVTVR